MARTMMPTEHAVLRAFGAARWVVWGWMVLTVYLQRSDLVRRPVAIVAMAAALAMVAGATVLLQRSPNRLLTPAWAVTDLGFGFALLVLDGLAYEEGHTFGPGQNLAGNWPLLAAISAAVAVGPRIGALGGLLVALGRVGGGLVNGMEGFSGDELVSVASTMVFYMMSGATLGWMAVRLREVETQVAAQRARDEVASTLHDGVLQTLAVVARRTQDTLPEIAALTRKTDRELRIWLFGGGDTEDELEPALRAAAQQVGVLHDLPVTVSVVADDSADVPRHVVHAVAGAVREAVTNAAKHGSPTKVVVFAEVDDDSGLFVSVHDDGTGFDPVAVTPSNGGGMGLTRSIRQRIEDVGGRVEIDSAPGRGTEVKLWVE